MSLIYVNESYQKVEILVHGVESIHLGLCFGNLSVLPAKEGKEAELGCEIHSQSPRGNALPAKVKRREEEWEDEQSAHAHLFLPIE